MPDRCTRSSEDDWQLLDEFPVASAAARQGFVAAHSQQILGAARGYPIFEPSELVGACWERILTRLSKIPRKDRGDFHNFLKNASNFACADYYRAWKRHASRTEVLDEDAVTRRSGSPIQATEPPDGFEYVVGLERHSRFWVAFNSLSEPHKKVIELYEFDGYSYDEAREILGVTMSALKVRLHRARLELKKLYPLDKEVT
jgi:RNA polymerase sigma-70 factor (ECF subfamily)